MTSNPHQRPPTPGVEENDNYEHDDNQDDDRDDFTPFIGCTGVDNCPMIPSDPDDDPPSEPR